MKYGLLHYRGDLTKTALPGNLLGHDELYRPYVIIDAEYDAAEDRTTVHVQTASAEELRQAAA
jgi:hypothetical protein